MLRLTSSLVFALLLFAGGISRAQTAVFSISPRTGCAPLAVSFTNNSTNATAFSWDFGNGSPTSLLQNTSAIYTSPGVYYVRLIASNATGADTLRDSVVVYNKPVANFSASVLTGCVSLTTTFSATVTSNAPGGISYTWVFGDGTTQAFNSSTASIPSISHTYSTAGIYSVDLYVSSLTSGCDSTFTRAAYINVNPKPVASFYPSSIRYCGIPTVTTLYSTTSTGNAPLTYTWNYGDGSTPTLPTTGSSVNHTYTAANTYNVGLKVTDANGCVDSINGSVLVVDSNVSIIVKNPVCQDELVAFSYAINGGTTPGGNWNFGDGRYGTGLTTTHIYFTGSTYTVSLSTSVSGCNVTVKKSLVVNPKPVTAIVPWGMPCPAPSTVNFMANAPGATSWQWKFGNGQTDTTQNATATYAARGVYTVQLIATTAAGCTDSVSIDTVYIRDIVVAVDPGGIAPDGLMPYAGCVPLTVNFSVNLFTHVPPPLPMPPGWIPYPYSPSTWLWDFGDGSPTSAQATPQHKYIGVGTYNVKCTITTPNGCTVTGPAIIKVATPVHPSFYATPISTCPNTPVTFVNTTSTTITPIVYEWVFGDTIISQAAVSSISYAYKKSDTYIVELVANHDGCNDTATKNNYITVYPATSTFTDSIFCPPSTKVKFRNSTLDATSQLWLFGDGTTDTSYAPVHTYPDTGTYYATLASYNSTYGCHDTAVRKIVLSRDSTSFTISRTAICTGDIVFVQGTWTGIGTPYYSYIFGSYQTPYDSTTSNSFFQFTNSGKFDVSMVVASGPGFVCHDTVLKKNLVLAAHPNISFAANPPIGCQPFTTSFTDSTSDNVPVVSRLWGWNYLNDPADTLRTPSKTISHPYPLRGFYDVYLIVTDSLGCVDSLKKNSYINVRKPSARFGLSAYNACVGQGLRFLDSSTGATKPLAHLWSFGDGTTSTLDTPKHSYSTAGTYTAQLIVTDSTGCMDTASSRAITIYAPHAAFTPSNRVGVCPPLIISFTNNSTGAVKYEWDFNTGDPKVPVFAPSATYKNAGVYVPVLVVTDQYGCTDTARDTIRILGYNGAFSYTPIRGCAPLPVQFSAPFGSTVATLTWDFSDGTTLVLHNNQTAAHTYMQPGSYLPKVIFSDGACSSASFGLDTIHVDKLTAHFVWDPVCVGVPFKLYDSSYAVFNAPDAYTWAFAPGDTASGTPVTHTYAASGNHSVTLTVRNASGCEASETRVVPVNALPDVDAGPDSTGVCPNDSVQLVATGAASYVWSPAADLSCTACATAYGHRVPGWYYVTGTDVNGCVNKDSIRAVIQIKTTSSVGPGGAICQGDTFRLAATGGTQYSWSPAAFLDSPGIAAPLARPPVTTTFIVAAQKSTCLVDSQRVEVVVHALPYFDAGPDEELRLGSAVILQASGSGYKSIAWVQDSTLSCVDCLRPTAAPYFSTVYRATFTDIYGCVSSDSVTVRVHCNGSLTFIPNTFTPNGDGENDVFYPRGEGIRRIITFRVFNRWGQMVFERMNVLLNDAKGGWDGTFNGQALPPDTYFYTMQTHCDTGEPLSWKGDITLVR